MISLIGSTSVFMSTFGRIELANAIDPFMVWVDRSLGQRPSLELKSLCGSAAMVSLRERGGECIPAPRRHPMNYSYTQNVRNGPKTKLAFHTWLKRFACASQSARCYVSPRRQHYDVRRYRFYALW